MYSQQSILYTFIFEIEFFIITMLNVNIIKYIALNIVDTNILTQVFILI